jgi:type IV pilus assembly protein PilW
MKVSNRQSGFTLVELMISIILGLLITAAAVQLFITGQVSLSMQKSLADIQDSGNFGLNYVMADLRKANLDAIRAVVDDQTAHGGIVLTTQNTPLKDAADKPIEIDKELLSYIEGGGDSALGLSNTNKKSDQLVIQYRANQIGTDCEGRTITAAEVDAGIYIVQRYFLRKDTNTNTNEPNQALALVCHAGRYQKASQLIQNYAKNDEGQIIMRRVDYFHVLLGVAEQINDGSFTNFRYLTIEQYQQMAKTLRAKVPSETPPRVLAVQLGAIVRAADSVGKDEMVKQAPTFTILDQDVTLNTPGSASSKYLRQAVTQTVTLRNAFGLSGAL